MAAEEKCEKNELKTTNFEHLSGRTIFQDEPGSQIAM